MNINLYTIYSTLLDDLNFKRKNFAQYFNIHYLKIFIFFLNLSDSRYEIKNSAHQ